MAGHTPPPGVSPAVDPIVPEPVLPETYQFGDSITVDAVLEPETSPEPAPEMEMIPKDLMANTKRRFKLVWAAGKTPELRPVQYQMCKNDILYWINIWCLAEGTPVVTKRGLVPIELVTSTDKVWDGESWVSQKGPLNKGCKSVMFEYGIWLTPNHKVWTTHGWQEAIHRYDRAEVRVPDSYKLRGLLSENHICGMAMPLRVRQGVCGKWWKSSQWKEWALRRTQSWFGDTRTEQKPTLSDVVCNEGPLYECKRLSLSSVRRAWDYCLRAMAGIREFLGGCWSASSQLDFGSYRQQWELRTDECALGYSKRAGKQYAEKSYSSNTFRPDVYIRNSHKTWDNVPGSSVSFGEGLDRETNSSSSSNEKVVYDLIDCGPKQAFTVIGKDGLPLLVHNCATYNPRKNPSTIPFITYPYEDSLILDLVEAIRSQKDILIDKSRDMGVTWCVLLVFTWFWQFQGEGMDFLVGSRKEQYIDQIGNMDTLLEKIRFIIRNQPTWLRPKGFDFKQHSNYLKIVNPDTKATITGEATNPNFSRSGRRRAIFFDEFAFWETDAQAWRASADSTNCRIVVSTPCGFNNQFAKLRHSGSIKTLSLHWRLHPEKDQAWYDNECIRRNHDAVEIAQELDINYEGSEEGVLFEFASLKSAVHNQPLMSPDRIVISLDPAGDGEDEAVFYVGNNGNIIERRFIAKSNDPQLAAESFMFIEKYKAQVFIADSIGNAVADLVVQLLGRNERGVKVIKFISSLKATDPTYFNMRDQVYHQAAVKMKSGLVQVDDDYTLQKQLNATKYKKDNGRIYINSKEEIKEMIGTSPDRADSWVLNVYGLQFTHSRKEVEQKETYRKVAHYDEVRSGEEYGSWGDLE